MASSPLSYMSDKFCYYFTTKQNNCKIRNKIVAKMEQMMYIKNEVAM